MNFTRYALYYVPSPKPAWVQFATSWLGWDMQIGQMVDHPPLPDLPLPLGEVTQAPRKYGLHATLKPPFRLAAGYSQSDLETACAELSRELVPVTLGRLNLTRLGRFLALVPPHSGDLPGLAATCVRALDRFRAPPTPEETKARRDARLTPRQEENLNSWGYPYVMDDFRFHLTLTGRLQKPDLNRVETLLDSRLVPLLSKQTTLSDLALVGEGPHGQFHLLRRFDLSELLPDTNPPDF